MQEADSHTTPLPRVDADRDTRGLVVFRASRLEALLEPFSTLLDVTWPDDPLQPQTVIAAHPGMKTWLVGALARKAGEQGIVANLDVVLPSTWMDREARQRLGHGAVSLPAYQRETLRWTLHEKLRDPAFVPQMDDPRILRMLSQDDAGEAARRRFQLADRLARLYAQYLVYRPDWLNAWEAGKFDFATARISDVAWRDTERRLLAPLWKAVVSQLGAHRATVMTSLVDALQRDEAGTRPALHVFGASHLAPLEFAALRAYAKHAMVALYVPDPCNEYWDVLSAGTSAPAWRQAEEALLEDASGGDWFHAQSHPLLSRWGRLGQQFFSALVEGPVREDIRHFADRVPDPRRGLLMRLQESVRQLSPAQIAPSSQARAQAQDDASLRVHACHTPLRELEVLRDVLLDGLAQGIAPGDMLVMAPDMQRYLPLLPAVFGPAGMPYTRLPYHTADVPMMRMHPLFDAFARILAMATSRMTAPEVADVLALPEVARRLGLDAEAVDALLQTLDDSRVAWGLDERHRASFGVPATAQNTWAWGLDRMLSAYLMSDATAMDAQELLQLHDGTQLLPLSGVQDASSASFGALDHLLHALQEWQTLTSRELKASEWSQRLSRLAEQCLRVDARDRAALDAWEALQQMLRGIASEPAAAGLDPVLHWTVVSARLQQLLSSVPERQPFLLGGITFSGMVPQRSIPFRLIAVLGLDEGEFPRHVEDGGLDLMARLRRIGDREQRDDDRYLFLETLMSARDQWHLFHVAEGVRDAKPRNPAAPLAELMDLLDAAFGVDAEASPQTRDAQRPWYVRHPLQPFDARAFDPAQPALQSHEARFASFVRQPKQPPAMRPFAGSGEATRDTPEILPLSAWLSYFRDPAAQLLEKRLRLDLDALQDDRLPEHEPLEARLDRRDRIAHRWLFDVLLPQRPAQPGDVAMPAFLRHGGLLPLGAAGDAAWARERDAAWLQYEAMRQRGWLKDGIAFPVASTPVTWSNGDHQVQGELANVLHDEDGALRLLRTPGVKHDKDVPKLLREGDLDFGKRLPLFLEWALLRLQAPADQRVHLALLLEDESEWLQAIEHWDEALVGADRSERGTLLQDLQARVGALFAQWQDAESRWYFPKSAWALANTPGDDRTAWAKSLHKVWTSGDFSTGEADYGLGQARWWARGVSWDADSAALHAMMGTARALDAILRLDRAWHT